MIQWIVMCWSGFYVDFVLCESFVQHNASQEAQSRETKEKRQQFTWYKYIPRTRRTTTKPLTCTPNQIGNAIKTINRIKERKERI